MYNKIINELNKLKNPKKAGILQRFFKTGKGEYGEGDIFLGLTVPQQRIISKKYSDTSLDDLQKLLLSNIHEYRLTALLILIIKFNKANIEERENIFNFYLKNTKNINNWDLVDLSAPNIVGEYLLNNKCHPELVPPWNGKSSWRNSASRAKLSEARSRNKFGMTNQVRNDKDCAILYNLAKSKDLWEKRIAIISTYAFIRNNHFEYTLKISEILINDKHDLIHKAVGWMLREVGKKDLKTEEEFLKKYYKIMPRTMLRYAIEKFEESKRKFYLNKV